jgi:hypothetical protein
MNYDPVLSKSISQDVSATESLDVLDKIIYIYISVYIQVHRSLSVRFIVIIVRFQVTIAMSCRSVNIHERKLRSRSRKSELHSVSMYHACFTNIDNIVTDLPGNSSVNTVQHATIEEAVFSM